MRWASSHADLWLRPQRAEVKINLWAPVGSFSSRPEDAKSPPICAGLPNLQCHPQVGES